MIIAGDLRNRKGYNMEQLPICPKCGLKYVDEHVGNLCYDCAAAKSKALFAVHKAGGKAIEKEAPAAVNETVIPFDMKRTKHNQVKLSGCEVVLRYDNGVALAVRLSAKSQQQVLKLIHTIHGLNKNKLQTIPIMVFDVATAQKMIEIIEKDAAQENGATTVEARQLIEAMKA